MHVSTCHIHVHAFFEWAGEQVGGLVDGWLVYGLVDWSVACPIAWESFRARLTHTISQ